MTTRKVSASVTQKAIGAALKKYRESLKMSQPEFAVKHDIKLGSLQRWEQGKNAPRLDIAIYVMKALGYERLESLDIDLGGLMDTLRGDMSKAKRECHHWVDEIFASGNEEVKDKVFRDLRRLGGQYSAKKEQQ